MILKLLSFQHRKIIPLHILLWCWNVNKLDIKKVIVLANIKIFYSVWKSPKNVSFKIASEASYAYIWNGQKFIKMLKND